MAIPGKEKQILEFAVGQKIPSIISTLDVGSTITEGSCLEFTQMSAITDLGLTETGSGTDDYVTELELRAVANKLDELLAALRTAGLLAT